MPSTTRKRTAPRSAVRRSGGGNDGSTPVSGGRETDPLWPSLASTGGDVRRIVGNGGGRKERAGGGFGFGFGPMAGMERAAAAAAAAEEGGRSFMESAPAMRWKAGGGGRRKSVADAADDGDRGTVVFTGRTLSSVRWLAQGAVVVVGSADGVAGQGFVRLYEYEEDGAAKLRLSCQHPGKVFGLSVCLDETTNRVLCASSDGVVRLFSVDEPRIDRVGGFSYGEAAAAAAALSASSAVGVGSEGSIVVIDLGTGMATGERTGSDGIGLRATSRISADSFVTAGMSGFASIWDARNGLDAPIQRLRYPQSRSALLCLDVDAAQTHYVFAGTDKGEVVCWDRRKEHFPVSRTAPHKSQVWDVRVMTTRPGILFSCGEDASVFAWDFTAASYRGIGVKDYWSAEVTAAEIYQLAVGRTLGVNSVDVHPRGNLVAYVTDSSTVTFTSFGSSDATA